jgi:hypothetical protein
MFGISTIKNNNKKIKVVNKKSKADEEQEKARAILEELNFPSDPIDILKLLEDKDKLEQVLKKLKMKVFW